ncbi:MAG: beta-eliminating lyase-related protein [Acidimicrobiales bacterium]
MARWPTSRSAPPRPTARGDHLGHHRTHRPAQTGAIEAVGHKVIAMSSVDGKLRPADLEAAIAANSQAPHMAKPRLVYVSNATELGTVYTRAELVDLRAACDRLGLLLMIDGARLGVALAGSRRLDHAGRHREGRRRLLDREHPLGTLLGRPS